MKKIKKVKTSLIKKTKAVLYIKYDLSIKDFKPLGVHEDNLECLKEMLNYNTEGL